jgi:O-acetyl-ADP-ribose deacetylase (regulator of RNase III)
VKIFLRDRKPELTEAWGEYFAGVAEVEVSTGDIFADISGVRADAIVSPANSFGFMDGGIDLAYSEHFGWDLQERLQTILRSDHDGELPVGQAVIVKTHHSAIKYLISAPTMRVPMPVADTVNAYLAFRAALQAAREYNRSRPGAIESILCPGLGTTTGRISPERCARQMYAAYANIVLGQTWAPNLLIDIKEQHQQLIR